MPRTCLLPYFIVHSCKCNHTRFVSMPLWVRRHPATSVRGGFFMGSPVFEGENDEGEIITGRTFTLAVLPGAFAICRVDPNAGVPDWMSGQVVSITRTAEELSIVCSQDSVPEDVRSDPDWCCLKVAGPLDLSMVGVIASLSGSLVAAGISVFVVSTFDTDYLLVKQTDLEVTVESLTAAGHVFSS